MNYIFEEYSAKKPKEVDSEGNNVQTTAVKKRLSSEAAEKVVQMPAFNSMFGFNKKTPLKFYSIVIPSIKYYFSKLLATSSEGVLSAHNFAIVMNKETRDDLSKNTSKIAEAARVKKEADKFIVSMPLYRFHLSDLFSFLKPEGDIRTSFYTNQQFVAKVCDSIEGVIPDFFYGSASQEYYIDPKKFLDSVGSQFFKSLGADTSYVELIENSFENLRVICPRPKSYYKVMDEDGNMRSIQTKEDFLDLGPQQQADAFNSLCDRYSILYFDFSIPKDVAEAITRMPFDDIPLSLIYNWAYANAKSAWSLQGHSRYPRVFEVNNISRVVKEQAYYKENNLLGPDNMSIRQNSSFIYLPQGWNKIKEYEDGIEKECFRTGEDGDDSFTMVDPYNPNENEFNQRNTRYANSLLLVDLKNNILVYTDERGFIKTENINDCRPVKAYNYVNYLVSERKKGPEDNNLSFINQTLYDTLNASLNDVKRSGIEIKAARSTIIPISILKTIFSKLNDIQYLYSEVQRFLKEFQLGNVSQSMYESKEAFDKAEKVAQDYGYVMPVNLEVIAEVGETDFEEFSNIFYAFKQYVNKATSSEESLTEFLELSERSVLTNLEHLGFLKAIVDNTGFSKLENLTKKDREERAVYITPPKEDPRESVIEPIPFFRDCEFLPHQVGGWNDLKHQPKAAILQVDAGGGKTVFGIADICFLLGKGKIKRPLIMCPGNLIKNYFQDGVYFTHGRINMVALSTKIINRWGLAELYSYIDSVPPNTIFIAEFSLLTSKERLIGYGPSSVRTYEGLELLKHINPDYIYLDEVHKLKNLNSKSNRSLMKVLPNVEFIRQATGTYSPDRVKDILGLFAMISPSEFGTIINYEDEFTNILSLDKRNSKHASPKPGFQSKVKQKMRNLATVIEIKRREWASLIPPRLGVVAARDSNNNLIFDENGNIVPETDDNGEIALVPTESFHFVEMDEAQAKLYEQILEDELSELEEKIKNDPVLAKKFLESEKLAQKTSTYVEPELEEESEEDEDSEDSDSDEEEDVDLESIGLTFAEDQLKPIIGRLEAFLCAPVEDKLGITLPKESHASPKIARIVSLLEEHEKLGIPGKVLIFATHVKAVAGTWDALPQEWKEKGVLYLTQDYKDNKSSTDTALAEFANSPEKTFMLATSTTLTEGQNLQFCSRLIRLETVWNWGTVEQQDARVVRPNTKGAGEFRKAIYIDWVLVNKSIDVTKASKMIAKFISTIKFVQDKNPRYAVLEDLEEVTLSRSTIQSRNDFDDPIQGLEPHLKAYQDYRQIEEAEFEEFRSRSDIRKTNAPIPDGGIIEGSQLLKKVPYIPQITLPGTQELNLVPLMVYFKNNPEKLDFEKDEIFVHTEYGDGTLNTMSFVKGTKIPSMISVNINGDKFSGIKATAAFVIDTDTIPMKQVRTKMAELLHKINTGVEKQFEEDNQPFLDILNKAPKKPKVKRVPREERLISSYPETVRFSAKYSNRTPTEVEPSLQENFEEIELSSFEEVLSDIDVKYLLKAISTLLLKGRSLEYICDRQQIPELLPLLTVLSDLPDTEDKEVAPPKSRRPGGGVEVEEDVETPITKTEKVSKDSLKDILSQGRKTRGGSKVVEPTEQDDSETEVTPINKKTSPKVSPTDLEDEDISFEEDEDFAQEQKEKLGSFNIVPGTINNQIVLSVSLSQDSTTVEESDLKGNGFVKHSPYVYISVPFKKASLVENWINSVDEKIGVDPAFMDSTLAQLDSIESSGSPLVFFENANSSDWRHFLLESHKPSKDGFIKPYLTVNGKSSFDENQNKNRFGMTFRVNMDLAGNPKAKDASKIPLIPGATWKVGSQKVVHLHCNTKQDALDKLKQLQENFDILNYDEAIEDVSLMKVLKEKVKSKPEELYDEDIDFV